MPPLFDHLVEMKRRPRSEPLSVIVRPFAKSGFTRAKTILTDRLGRLMERRDKVFAVRDVGPRFGRSHAQGQTKNQ